MSMTQIPVGWHRWMPGTIVPGTTAAYAPVFTPLCQAAADIVIAFIYYDPSGRWAARWLLWRAD
jgi:hypothetical protein